ncbi:MAG: flavodoxin domain-containing protein [[Eubacterium] saphenum]|nr:flavodoxin domain-containing protein [[Eubacterium] saphenum]
MKTIVVYKSKTGYTKKYAEWIAEELGCDIKENAALSDILGYDTIICGGGVYAGSINGGKLITKNLGKLSGKKLVLFAVGAMLDEEKDVVPFWNKLLNAEQQKSIGHFFLRGGFDFNQLKGADRLMMSMIKKHLEKIKEPTDEDKGFLAAFSEPVDFTDRKNLAELLQYAKNNGAV